MLFHTPLVSIAYSKKLPPDGDFAVFKFLGEKFVMEIVWKECTLRDYLEVSYTT